MTKYVRFVAVLHFDALSMGLERKCSSKYFVNVISIADYNSDLLYYEKKSVKKKDLKSKDFVHWICKQRKHPLCKLIFSTYSVLQGTTKVFRTSLPSCVMPGKLWTLCVRSIVRSDVERWKRWRDSARYR